MELNTNVSYELHLSTGILSQRAAMKKSLLTYI